MTWVSEDQRNDTKDRLSTNLEAMVFHNGLVLNDITSKVSNIEKQALAASNSSPNKLEGLRTYKAKLGEQLVGLLTGVESMDTDVSTSSEKVLDLSTTERELLTKERCEEVLAPMLAKGAAFTKVRLSTRSFGMDAAPVAAAALKNNASTLEELDVSDILAGRPTDEARQALRTIIDGASSAQLKSLDVSDNALGEVGVRALTSLLPHQTRLETLKLLNDGISAEAAGAANELMVNAHTLKTLHFYNNMSGDKGAMAMAALVKRATKLESYRMSCTRVMEDGMAAVGEALGTLSTLKWIDLKDNNACASGGAVLARAILNNRGLTCVHVSDIAMENTGTLQVARALAAACPDLKELAIGGNDLTTIGMMKIAPVIGKMSNLEILDVSVGEIRDKGAQALAAALHNLPKLHSLVACDNQLQDEGALALAKVMTKQSKCTLVALDENMISDEGVQTLTALVPPAALGTLEQNDEEGEVDEDEEEEEEEEQEMTTEWIHARIRL
mmetsp:Transcript_21553/g.25956  ORF Transcript_21553/g.25956 Transcript_21553/m.25956 type:complete len:501 (-) Transcript_21553:594-2096(-)